MSRTARISFVPESEIQPGPVYAPLYGPDGIIINASARYSADDIRHYARGPQVIDYGDVSGMYVRMETELAGHEISHDVTIIGPKGDSHIIVKLDDDYLAIHKGIVKLSKISLKED